MENWHAQNVKEVFKYFSSHPDGISQKEAEERIEKYGPNTIRDEKRIHPLMVFLKQFQSGLVYVLIAAAVISGIFDKMIDVYVILAVIVLNAVLGFVQEYKAEKAIDALKSMVVPVTKVYRDGELLEISAENLVVGDVVVLEEGTRVPADMRLFYTKNLRNNEASLTGESVPSSKNTDQVPAEADLGDRKNMAWMGTFVAGGKGKGVVVGTGDQTAFGVIAKDISGIERKGSHFEDKISRLAKQMAFFAFGGSFLIFSLSLYTQRVKMEEVLSLSEGFQDSVLFAIAALVSGIPEGLPAILSVVLAIGATRMAKRNAIIRKLPATETLGVADHIVTDKTGTLTQNTMNVRKIILATGTEIDVTGEGWEPEGKFIKNGEIITPLNKPNLEKLLHIAGVCNEAQLTKKEGEEKHQIIGDPTEAALVVLSQKAGLNEELIHEKERKLDDMPFNSKLKYRASLSVLLNGKEEKQIYVVGAPEEIMERIGYIEEREEVRKIKKEDKDKIIGRVEKMTREAMRTIGIAYKKVPKETEEIDKDVVDDLVLVGVVGIVDPPRLEVKEAIAKAKGAGIRVIMTTGDHKGTALAISREIGLVEEDDERAFTQRELSEMSQEDFERAVSEVNVFARLTPHMKLLIAKTLQEKNGAVVAMTGDGVNDAPAVKQADIGIAMGIAGTDVTKEAGEIILADDNFASIVSAIEEGRIVFRNTKQASTTLISTNFAEHITIIVSLILLGGQLPFLPTQILWLNLITDGFSGAPLAAEPGHSDILKEKPRDKNEGILTMEVLPLLILTAVVMATLTLLAFNHYQEVSIQKAQTAAFSVMAFTQLFRAINMRDMKRSVFKIGFFKNKYLIGAILFALFLQVMVIRIPFFQQIFNFESIDYLEVFALMILSSLVFFFGEIYKYIRYQVIEGNKIK